VFVPVAAFFGRLILAGVSRQSAYRADASAVQFKPAPLPCLREQFDPPSVAPRKLTSPRLRQKRGRGREHYRRGRYRPALTSGPVLPSGLTVADRGRRVSPVAARHG
jgi:hypothetical protein